MEIMRARCDDIHVELMLFSQGGAVILAGTDGGAPGLERLRRFEPNSVFAGLLGKLCPAP